MIIAVAFLAVQITAYGQKKDYAKKQDRPLKAMNFTAEEMATLHTKKMTLHLDLNASQQDKIYEINLENAKKRKAFMEKRKAQKESGKPAEKPSKEQRLEMMNKRLDHQIATKQKMKEILNEEQFAKWEKFQSKKSQRNKSKLRKKGDSKKRQ